MWAGIGYFDVGGDVAEEPALEVTYRFGSRVLRHLNPRVGGMVTPSASAYLYGGVELPLALGRRLWITPSLGAGVYRKGNGLDLGSTLEFRSGIDISNASLADRNPGVEVLGLGYSFLH
jgi:lipid A 3-O-deacylase